MPPIFISYRRFESQDVTGRIYDRLVTKFTPKGVFKDVDNIPLGVSFPLHIQQMLSKASVVLVIIGPGWLTASDAQGRRRLDDPNDFVRLEVETALRAGMPVIPVLVSNASMPAASELPRSLQKLVSRNGISVRPDPDFNNDITRLFAGLDNLEKLLQAQPENQAKAQKEAAVPVRGSAGVREPAPCRSALPAVPAPRRKRRLAWLLAFLVVVLGGAAGAVYFFELPVPWWNRSNAKADLVEHSKQELVSKGPEYIKKTGPQRIAIWRQAAEQGSAEGQFLFSCCLQEGAGIAKNEAESLAWLRKSAEQGLAPAQQYLGLRYYSGKGGPGPAAAYVLWFRKAAEQGHPGAQRNLGGCYEYGYGVAKDPAEAARWFRKAAEQGEAGAQNILAWCYINGTGVGKDRAEAARWFRQAADQGVKDAQHMLGNSIRDGWVAKGDPAAALSWYRKAADQEYALSQYMLGDSFYNGNGVAKDFVEGVRWYRKAADQGYVKAQSSLGWIYENGQGVVKNLAEAERWYRKAAEQGDADAQKAVDRLTKKSAPPKK